MAASSLCFVEWKEQFVSKERGNRVVHYYLKDIAGESILAVVGTERSVRHMFYVVSEEFLNAHGAEDFAHAGYRWRSRREVVNWLTSMLSKQYRHGDHSKSSKGDPMNSTAAQSIHIPDCKGRLSRNLKGHVSDIVWSGESWACGKQLKHYPAFCRNGITIAIQSFVFVMAEEENRYLAYLEDLYEDRKGQKKVKVRWFHHNREVKGVVSVRNHHPKEVFITPYAQVISVECVDGPAIVLTREHYEKCIAVLPQDLLPRLHLCFRQFKGNRVKPFKLSRLCGYFDQPIFSCMDPDLFDHDDFSPQDNVKVGTKRTRSSRGNEAMPYNSSGRKLKYGMRRSLIRSKYPPLGTSLYKINEKIELLCQDSGIRGCWFRCTILQISQKQIHVQYDDLENEDGSEKLEEWIPAFRLAMPDKLGMRHQGRPIIRPAVSHNESLLALEAGAPVDAWWSDGWWEGVLIGIGNSEDGILQVFVPSENLFLNVHGKNLRASRDWTGDQWVDIETNASIISAISAAISPDTKHSTTSTNDETKSYETLSLGHEGVTNVKIVEDEKLELACLANQDGISENVEVELASLVPQDGISGNMDCSNEEVQLTEEHQKISDNNVIDNGNTNDADEGDRDKGLARDGFKTSGVKCEPEPMEVVAA